MSKLFLPLTAAFFRKRWRESEVRVSELARRCGYANVSRGVNRFRRFIETGVIHDDLLTTLATVLNIDSETISQLKADDYRAWCDWADEPVRPYLVLRLMAAIYNPVSLPEEVVTLEEAEWCAAELAKKRRMKVALVWSRRLTIYFDEEGQRYGITEAQPGQPNTPSVKIGGTNIVY